MIRFTLLSIKNFLSYGAEPTIIPLDRPGTTLILGEDLDNTSTGGASANGVGKAQPVDSLVKVPGSWKRMGDLQIGDTVSTPDGAAAPITGVFPQGKRDTYRITFQDGRQTEASDEHLWSVFSHRWGDQYTRGTKVITTTELKEYVDTANTKAKAWYNIFVPLCEHENNSDVELPLDPYLLGALLGDGCLSTPQIRFSTIDAYIAETISATLKEYGDTLKHDVGCDYHVNGLSTKKLLGSLIGTKSNTKHIPDEYLKASRSQKIKLLQGLLDTDGTVSKNGNVSFCSVSKQLTKDVQYLIRSIGGKATISTRTPSYTDDLGIKIHGQLAYNVSIHYRTPSELFSLPRKKEKTKDITQYSNSGLRVVAVEQIEPKECRCIHIDHPDHLYITDEFVVTHNTVIINALSYGVYDKPVSNISKDNLVNNINKKHMEVIVEFEKGGKHYRIRRVRKAKAYHAGNFVELFENGVDITPDSVANTNRLIEDIMGLPYELFVRIVVFSATHIPFLDLPLRSQHGPNQTDIIEELFDLKTLSEKSAILKEQQKEVETELDKQKARVELLEQEHDRYKKQLQSAKQRVVNWENTTQQEKERLQKKLDRVRTVDIETQHTLHDQVITASDAVTEAERKLRDVEKEFTKASKELKQAEAELAHLVDEKCPYCLQQYSDSRDKIIETEKTIKAATAEVEQLGKQKEEINELVQQLETKREEIRNQITVPDLEELMEIQSKSSEYERRITELENAVNPYLEPLDELEAEQLEEIDYNEVNKLTQRVEHMKFLYKLLTKKDSFVRKVLLNKNLPFLNQRLQDYLTKLGLSHQVEFTHQMTAQISQFGRELDFGNLSHGQRARVNLALSFAFRDVLQNLHEHINICMLDEVLDIGLDGPGVTAAARMLKRKARDENLSLYIISHRDEIDSAFDRTMIVQLSEGFSTIAEET